MDGSLGVVLVRARYAEHGDHGVADELLDEAAVDLDRVAGHVGVLPENAIDVLRVGALGHACEADEVAEQGRDDFAFLDQRSGPTLQAGAAGRTEAGVLGCLRVAAGARGHDVPPAAGASPSSSIWSLRRTLPFPAPRDHHTHPSTEGCHAVRTKASSSASEGAAPKDASDAIRALLEKGAVES